ncbi:MAG TPA: NADPH-dependent F420 reductase [Promineifilum sp.]|nr:NADPH-dependent F420 reductase [Promineifilum sp.]
MKIAIIGTGQVAAALGVGWAARGHTVTFASRGPETGRVQALLDRIGPNVTAAPPADAAGRSSVIVLAVPFTAVQESLQAAGDLGGKVIIDCTNPIAPGLRSLFDDTTSGAEQIAAWSPRARVVKAFNTTGAENMVDPVYGGRPATMFMCGDDGPAKGAAAQLAEELGFEVVDAGDLTAARHLEHLALAWIHLANVAGLGRDIAFRLERR